MYVLHLYTTDMCSISCIWIKDNQRVILQNMSSRGHTVSSHERSPSALQASSSEVQLKAAEWGKNHLLWREQEWRGVTFDRLMLFSIYNQHMLWLLLERICLSVSRTVCSPPLHHDACFCSLDYRLNVNVDFQLTLRSLFLLTCLSPFFLCLSLFFVVRLIGCCYCEWLLK